MSSSIPSRPLCVAEIAERLGAKFRGDGQTIIGGLASIDNASADKLCFAGGGKFLAQLSGCQAGAVLLRERDAAHCVATSIYVDDPYLAYARVSQWLHGAASAQAGVHSSAVVAKSAIVSEQAEIGPQVVVESGVVIEAGVVLGAGCFIGAGSHLGSGTRLFANVTVYHGCVIGRNCRVQSGAVIGADGFGFAPAGAEGWQRIEQIGGVRVGDRVEIGACTTIDRGALDDTVIEDGVIIDNHVQIAHNVTIGQQTAIAGCVGIAGSTKIGPRCQLGGGSSIVGHLTIEEGVVVFANTFVTSSLRRGVYASATAAQPVADWRRNQPTLRQLHKLIRRFRPLLGKPDVNRTATPEPPE